MGFRGRLCRRAAFERHPPRFLGGTSDEIDTAAAALVYAQPTQGDFNIDATLPDGARENLHVTRWNLPLTNAMVRAARPSQGLTFKGGVLADMRKKGNMTDDAW